MKIKCERCLISKSHHCYESKESKMCKVCTRKLNEYKMVMNVLKSSSIEIK